MTNLNIRILGEFHLALGDQPPVAFNSMREQTLLVYLLLHRHTASRRQHVAFLLWPDSTEAQAQNNLRRTLHHLRRKLPDADIYLSVDSHTIGWRSDAPITLDVADFETTLEAARAMEADDASGQVEALEAAVAFYNGALLPGCYDDWILAERERLRARYIQALEQLTRLLEERRAIQRAIQFTDELVRTEPLQEAAYRRLMRLHALNGDRASALRTYHRCVTMLERELDVTPSHDLRVAYERILQQKEPQLFDHGHAEHPAQGLVPLVGRQKEWQILRAAWQRAARGQAQFLLISGEAGIGKTRLAEELFAWADRQGITTARTRAYATAGDLAYAPVAELLRASPLQRALDKMDEARLGEIARLLPELRLERPALPRPGPMEGGWQRRLLYEALASTVTADGQPKLLLIDDLQWCDPETLSWLAFLTAFEPTAPVLVLSTVRPEEVDREHPLTSLLLDLRSAGRLTEIELGPLNLGETKTLATNVAQGSFDAALASELYDYTEGNPLYVTETVRAGFDREVGSMEPPKPRSDETEVPLVAIQPSTLPPKVHATIQRRLSQLSPDAHDLVCLAAVIGRSFTFATLAQASDLDEADLMRGLDELWLRRIVREQTDATYDFTHDRIREVAYSEASPIRRQILHKRVGEALESLFPDKGDDLCSQLGRHFSEAQQWSPALRYYRLAANVSADVGASNRVLFYADKVLAILDRLPNTQEHVAWRIDNWLQMARAQIGVVGWSAPQRREVLELAYQRAVEVKDERRQLLAIDALFSYYANLGDWHTASELSQEMLTRARKLADDRVLHVTYLQVGNLSLQRGELAAALESYRQGIALEKKTRAKRHHKISLRSRLAETLWLCGYAEQARTLAVTATQMADKQGDPFGRLHSREFAMYTAQRAGDKAAVHRLAHETIALCTEFNFPDYALTAQVFLGWLAAESGSAEIGARQVEQALADMVEMNVQFNMPYFLSVLVQAQRRDGQVTQALQNLERALELTEKSGDSFWKAEIMRLTGDLYWRTGHAVHEVESLYEAARTLARQQHAKILELRAVVSLARLWRDQGKRADARQALAAIYDWFNEGFEGADLQMAHALLTELDEAIG